MKKLVVIFRRLFTRDNFEVLWENIIYWFDKILAITYFLFRWVLYICIGYGVYWYWKNLIGKNEINVWEIRFYIGTFLLLLIVLVFGVLRLYNAIVSNTRFLIRLRNKLDSFSKDMKKGVRDFSTNSKTLTQTLKTLERVVRNFTEIVKFLKKNDNE